MATKRLLAPALSPFKDGRAIISAGRWDVGSSIRVDKLGRGRPTSTMTVMTDKLSNSVTALSGILKLIFATSCD